MSTRRTTALCLGALIAVISAVSFALCVADGTGGHAISGVNPPESGLAVAAFECGGLAAFGAIGALVAFRRPSNPIGWLMCLIPLSLSVGVLAGRLGWHALLGDSDPRGFASVMYWVTNWTWVLTVVPIFTFLPLLFPSGSPPTRRWRVAGWAAGAGMTGVLIGYALDPGRLDSVPAVENPISVGGAGDAAWALGQVAFFLFVAAALASAASLGVRFRRSHGAERQQIKWMFAAAAVLLVMFPLSAVVESAVGESASWPVLLLGLYAAPAAVAIGILRYRLYDIDVVIKRTLVYGLLTATLGLAYLGSVLLLQLLLRPLTEQSDLAIAGSTLAVAALFGPARRRIQAIVDRRFYRRRYDAALTLEAFNARLRNEVDLDHLNVELHSVLRETMQPAHVSLWLRAPRG